MNGRRTQLIERVTSAFQDKFGSAPAMLVAAPGRVNLIGEHCDYNDGYVLPMAIDYETIVAIGPSKDDEIHVAAADYQDATDQFYPNGPYVHQSDDWKNHVRGCAAVLRDRGYEFSGANLVIVGNVPRGAGLSSSASLGVGLAKAFAEFNGTKGLSATDYALIGKQAENEHVGMACGIMDQLVSAKAEEGSALLIDCRTLKTTPVSLPDELSVLIIHSGVERQLVDSPFNRRREECEQAADHYGVAALRDLNEEQLISHRGSLDDAAFRRARHVVTEIARTVAAVDALQSRNIAAMSELMYQSHLSLRDDFEVTVPAIDEMVAMIGEKLGTSGGVRMTGGGFGGCVVALVPDDRLDEIEEHIRKNYRTPDNREPQMFRCIASAGASIL